MKIYKSMTQKKNKENGNIDENNDGFEENNK